MPTFEQAKYCPTCKKNVSADKNDRCKVCGRKIERGAWSVRFRVMENAYETHKRLGGYKTKKEAQNGFIEYMNILEHSNTINTTDNIKFEQLYEEYKKFTQSRIKESSYYDFCSKCNLHILPYFKDMDVRDLTPKILLDWQNSINKYSYKYKSGLRMYLNSILNYGEKYYNLDNKLRKVDQFRNVELKKEMLIWTPVEFNSFITEVKNEIYKTFFYALYYTGARKGEILATTWEDWDLKKGILNINKTVTKKVFGVSWLVTKPKNQSSIRKVSLPPILIEIMNEYKIGKENYQFVFADSKPLADSNIERIQIDACNKANVKKIRLHDFRHSHASLLISKGVPIVAVAKRLGHSNIEQTLNTYAHMLPEEDDLLLNVLQNTVKK